MNEWAVRAFAPGRTELAGNHLDHQGGRVLAATVRQGVQVLARRNGTGSVNVKSRGFMPVHLDLAQSEPQMGEAGTSAALVRGMLAGLRQAGVTVPGFDAEVTSTLPAGGGLSSSAAFEMALGRAMEALAGVSQLLPPLQLAAMGARAERDYFGKPCGLLDQSVIACGGIVALDFENPDSPSVEPIDFDFEACGCAVVLVDVRCDHSEFTGEYARLVNDMSAAAAFFGAERLCQVPEGRYLAQFRELGRKRGDDVALRGFHYYNELRLADARIAALRAGNLPAFLEATRRSGASSAQYLRNVWLPESSRQPAMMALALADFLLDGQGAVRIHGGGFGGTIQAFVPHDALDAFVAGMEGVLGRGACHAVQLLPRGAYAQRIAGEKGPGT